MSLKSRTKTPPTGWVYRQPETGWSIKMSTPSKLLEAIRDHRIENNLGRTTNEEIWEDVEAHICGLLAGKWALWDFCNTKIPRPVRANTQPVTAPAVNPFPVRQQSTVTKAEAVMAEITARKDQNAAAKTAGQTKKRPCATCGKRRS